jgi:acyl carrier protein
MTPNGKIDRAALQVAGGSVLRSTPVAEREKTPVEDRVAAIWAEMLGVRPSEWTTTSSRWGGHSLLAARVIRALNNTFAVTLPLRVLFDAPTVGRFATCSSGRWSSSVLPMAGSSAHRAIRALSHGQEMTPTERRLAAIWEKILGVGSVGPSDNFFALGAESHPIAQLFEGIRAEFGKDLPVMTLMESPTLEGLARRIDSSSASATSLVMPLKAGGTRTPVFGIHDGAGYFFYWKFAAAVGDDRPVYGIQARVISTAGRVRHP